MTAAPALALQIAERIHAIGFDDIPTAERDWAASAFVDTIGVTLAGIVEDGPRILMRVPGVATADGPALIHGTSRRTSVLDAALVNGVAAHALDFDDVAASLGGHPSAMLVPALIPLAEALGRSGQDLVLAYVVGFETACRIARGVHFHHYEKGWHPTATLGIFGTVAGASVLLGLPVDRTAVALGMAASLASGLKANFGTMTKPLHVGHAVRNGVFAALMAREGFTANPAAFEHRQGFLDVFNGPGTYETARILDEWYAPFECGGAGDPGLKPYPCCGSTHPSIGRMLDLARHHDLKPDQVARITVMPHARRLPHTNNPDPRTPLAAKFSIQYVVARALVDRSVKLADFEGEAHFDPAIRAVMAKIIAQPHPDMPEDWGTEVVVETTDGRRLASRLDDYPSRGPAGDPMTHAELWGKFADCAERSLPRGRLSALFDTLMGVATLADVRELTALLSPPADAAQAA
ncbi:MmgE/PrpD family protein [Rhodopila sp.]|uniref:MmgE/PrpD family protein n=1 Tax=Rhodopila sp. TaxID=2480087 RepID=UPI002C8625F8|nr:MmgE/PrpD family protein [Rhodopila sp.]HVZ09171.1 MmgE/PrpD family protein [Rhodopila sp.]